MINKLESCIIDQVPTLEDNGDVIWDSHGIITYLVDKYASDDSLYPRDLYQRARVNQRLFFNCGNMSQNIFMLFRHAFGGGTEILQEHFDRIGNSYKLVEAFLTDSYLVGDQLTVADISVGVTVSLLRLFNPLDDEQYPNTVAWLDRINENVSNFAEVNDVCNQEIFDLVMGKMESNKESA